MRGRQEGKEGSESRAKERGRNKGRKGRDGERRGGHYMEGGDEKWGMEGGGVFS